jgi:hypothetical protein
MTVGHAEMSEENPHLPSSNRFVQFVYNEILVGPDTPSDIYIFNQKPKYERIN